MLTPFLIAEGYRVDHFGNVVNSTYVDLREPAARHPIPALVKGCEPEYVIEECGIVKVSTPWTFRNSGENLIRDPAEGYYAETRVLHDAVDDPQDMVLAKERDEALNRAAELVGFSWRRNTTSTRRTVSETDTLEYAPVGWLFCASIEPATPEEWISWWASLGKGYSSKSHIYRPREFASALGHMAAEQLGPQGPIMPVTSTLSGLPSSVTRHPSQQVFHGPVVYVDNVYDWLLEARSEHEFFLRALFSKKTTHRDQKEYRFIIWTETKPESEFHLLQASPALIDAMTRQGNEPTPPVMQAVLRQEDSLIPARHAGAEPNPLAGNKMWSDLESSMAELARRPEAVVRPSQLNPALLPDDFDLQTATYAGVKALRHKVGSFYRLPDQTAESRRAVVAAAWFAEQDIRALCETFADPIAGISISGDGFVKIHISMMERPDFVCLLAVAPSGESALRMDGEGHGWRSVRSDPFHRTNIGQKVKDFLGELPSCQ